MTNNPCDECIVKAMCKKPCDSLTDYLIENLPNPRYHNWRYGTIGKAIKERIWKLHYLNNKVIGIKVNEESL